MIIVKKYDAYNVRRYSVPWVCKITDDGKFDFSDRVGRYTGGNSGDAGELYIINPEEGQIYAYGQKDYRGRNGGYEYAQYKNGKLHKIAKADLIDILIETKGK